ncbi:5' nucleotidase, NT5C type [Lederbergia citrea]|uniref:Nucleotidase n=1 Tax=Lederbergia citrea TaxID=2833581 RepID=A0A942Z529_9BACI|nr:hypothetical protein [Lederbergia citrea]MBS4202882.1 hypothetical protein [Lederbergia citrea]MBS4222451.1 hypothetical protein [Lederbergia citrea]
MQKRFGIDIDGTVTCPTSLVPHINKAFQLDITLDDLTEYEITECLNIPKDSFYKWFVEAEPQIYSESPLAKGAKPVLSKWVDEHELYFISARSETLLDVTKTWFNTFEINYHHIELIGSHDKVGTAQKHNIDLFFEDKHDNAVDISEELNIPVILFDTPYNRKPSPKNVIRVHNWQEAEQWVENWLRMENEIKKEA